MKKILFPLTSGFFALALAACGGGDDCGACAQAAADAHAEATYDASGNSWELTCGDAMNGGQQSFTIGTEQCEVSALGITLNVNDTIRDALTSCNLSVPAECN